jgi:hypothetical protein
METAALRACCAPQATSTRLRPAAAIEPAGGNLQDLVRACEVRGSGSGVAPLSAVLRGAHGDNRCGKALVRTLTLVNAFTTLSSCKAVKDTA